MELWESWHSTTPLPQTCTGHQPLNGELCLRDLSLPKCASPLASGAQDRHGTSLVVKVGQNSCPTSDQEKGSKYPHSCAQWQDTGSRGTQRYGAQASLGDERTRR